eukprot:2783218-Amphidinium_carterae.1
MLSQYSRSSSSSCLTILDVALEVLLVLVLLTVDDVMTCIASARPCPMSGGAPSFGSCATCSAGISVIAA